MTKAKKTELSSALWSYIHAKQHADTANNRLSGYLTYVSNFGDFDPDRMTELIRCRNVADTEERDAFEKACELLFYGTKLGQSDKGKQLAVRLIDREHLERLADLAEFIDLAF